MNTERKKQKIWELIKLSPGWMAAAVFLALLSTVAYFVPYVVISRIIRELLNNGVEGKQISMDLYMRYGLFALTGASVHVITYFASLSAAHVGAFRISFRLKTQLLEHLAKIPLGEQIHLGSGKIQQILNENVSAVQSFFAHEVTELVIALLAPLSLFLLFLRINFWYTLILSLGLLLAGYFDRKSYSYAAGGGKKMMDIYLSALERMNQTSIEFVRGAKVIKIFGNGTHARKELEDSVKSYSENCISYTLIWEKYRCIFNGIMSGLYLVLLPAAYVLLRRSDAATTILGDLAVFLVLVPALTGLLPKVQDISNQTVGVEMAMDRMRQILDLPKLEEADYREEKPENGEIEFSHVDFSYGGDAEVLKDVSFVTKEGSLTAIVGPSGSGKSTVVRLLARFWDVSGGSIKIGGINIKDLKTEVLMKQEAFVFQDPFLFHKSIAENIRGNASVSQEQIEAAARMARCHGFITELPEGYDTIIGNSVKLSGGQKQRIAIARAIVKDAPILILDEATASSDIENEYELQQIIHEFAKTKTVLMVAHRLTNVVKADQILYMEDGRILESGTHEELMRRNGAYRKMWMVGQENINWRIR